MYIIQELAELATKATDQAEESEGKFKSCIAEKENLLQKFADEKQELLDKLNQLQDVISDKDQELKVSNHLFCKHSMKGGTTVTRKLPVNSNGRMERLLCNFHLMGYYCSPNLSIHQNST